MLVCGRASGVKQFGGLIRHQSRVQSPNEWVVGMRGQFFPDTIKFLLGQFRLLPRTISGGTTGHMALGFLAQLVLFAHGNFPYGLKICIGLIAVSL